MLLSEEDKLMLNMWESEVLRKMCGSVIGEVVWRIRTNQELRESYKTPDLEVEINRRMLEGLGHAIRMDQTRVAKKLFENKTEGRRKVRRPRLRGLEDVEKWKPQTNNRRMGICQ
jgi:hypothetical protein